MPTYQEIVVGLGRLETFEAWAFTGDAQCPQEVCDLILGLALVYNDLRDVVLAQTLMENVKPADVTTPTVELGQFNGITSHLVRLQAGIVHELLNLVRKNKAVAVVAPFPQLLGRLSNNGRTAWEGIVAAAEGRDRGDALGRLLRLVRHKVVFHYDLKVLRKGYAQSFLVGGPRVPYLSLGASMARTRFYFAEAAADTHMRENADAGTVEDFFGGRSALLMFINKALSELVVRFLRSRKAGWTVQRHHA